MPAGPTSPAWNGRGDGERGPMAETPKRERGPAQQQPHGPGSEPRTPASAGEASDTRKTLMELLKRAGETDVASLAKQLGISGVAVRQHLAALERDGKVTQRSVRRPVGRPAGLYRLTAAADEDFPQANAKVALDLLARLEKLMGADAVHKLLRERLRELQQTYQDKLRGARSLGKKLQVLAEIRDAEGYLCSSEPAPRSEARGGVRLVEHHCPLAELAHQHPEVCDYELELFRLVLGEPELRRVEHIRSGGHACAYELPGKDR